MDVATLLVVCPAMEPLAQEKECLWLYPVGVRAPVVYRRVSPLITAQSALNPDFRNPANEVAPPRGFPPMSKAAANRVQMPPAH
jgi:hypothetical protein